jgi:hypothetical protein
MRASSVLFLPMAGRKFAIAITCFALVDKDWEVSHLVCEQHCSISVISGSKNLVTPWHNRLWPEMWASWVLLLPMASRKFALAITCFTSVDKDWEVLNFACEQHFNFGHFGLEEFSYTLTWWIMTKSVGFPSITPLNGKSQIFPDHNWLHLSGWRLGSFKFSVLAAPFWVPSRDCL